MWIKRHWPTFSLPEMNSRTKNHRKGTGCVGQDLNPNVSIYCRGYVAMELYLYSQSTPSYCVPGQFYLHLTNLAVLIFFKITLKKVDIHSDAVSFVGKCPSTLVTPCIEGGEHTSNKLSILLTISRKILCWQRSSSRDVRGKSQHSYLTNPSILQKNKKKKFCCRLLRTLAWG